MCTFLGSAPHLAIKRHTLPVCQKVCLSSTSHGRGRLNDSNGFLVSDPISGEIPVRVYLSAKPVEWIQLVGHVKSLYFRFILSKIFVSSLHFLHHGGTDESWARYTTLNHWMKGSILCKYMISKIPDSDSHHFISMVNSCESQGAFVPNMLLGDLVGRLFGGLLESMHLQVEVLDEKLKRWYVVHTSFEDMY